MRSLKYERLKIALEKKNNEVDVLRGEMDEIKARTLPTNPISFEDTAQDVALPGTGRAETDRVEPNALHEDIVSGFMPYTSNVTKFKYFGFIRQLTQYTTLF